MSRGRRFLLQLAFAGATAAVLPAAAGAQGLDIPGCTYPKSWDQAGSDVQYEASLFSGQTQFDMSRLTSTTLVPFANNTARRAQRMTNSIANVFVDVIAAGIADPPSCGG